MIVETADSCIIIFLVVCISGKTPVALPYLLVPLIFHLKSILSDFFFFIVDKILFKLFQWGKLIPYQKIEEIVYLN